MNTAVARTRRPIQQELRYYVPRWMLVLVVITLIPQLIMFPPAGRGFWYIPGLVLMGLVDGAFGGVLFAFFALRAVAAYVRPDLMQMAMGMVKSMMP